MMGRMLGKGSCTVWAWMWSKYAHLSCGQNLAGGLTNRCYRFVCFVDGGGEGEASASIAVP